MTGPVGRGHGTRATTRAGKNRSGGVDGFLSGVVFRLEDIAVSNSRRCKLIIKFNGVAKSILAQSLLKEDQYIGYQLALSTIYPRRLIFSMLSDSFCVALKFLPS